VGNDRNRLDLNQHIIAKQPPYLHGRTRGWLLGVDVLIAYRTHDGDLRYVEQEVGKFHDMLEACSDTSQRSREIFEDLCRLRRQVIPTDQVARSVQRHLPRDINRPAAMRLNHMGVANRSMHRRWV